MCDKNNANLEIFPFGLLSVTLDYQLHTWSRSAGDSLMLLIAGYWEIHERSILGAATLNVG